MTKEKRLKTLHNLGILTLILVSLFFINELFGNQIVIIKTAINSLVIPFGIALFISYLLAPLVALIEKHFKIKYRTITVLLVFIIVLVVFGIFTFFIGKIIYEQGSSFILNDWDGIIDWINTTVESNPYLTDAYHSFTEYVNIENASPFIFNIVNLARSVGSIVIIIVLIPVFLFFLLKDKTTVFNGIVSIVPRKYQVHLRELGTRANTVIQKYFNGRFLSMFIMSILLTIMFLIFGFGFERSLFFGFVLGFLDIIPYIGSFVGILLPILYSFTIQDQVLMGEWTFVGLIVTNAILQGFQNGILQPYIMGKEVNLHPLLVLSSFIFFGALFGITGVILAIPITGIIKTTINYFNELKEKEKEKNNKKILKKT
jgi:putative permease